MTTSSHPRVSVVITAYNAGPYLAEAIESVLGQSRPPDELLVVDDGSADETAAVAARYAPSGVRYIYQENRGPSAARNHGARETSGEYLAFLDADDIWLPGKLAAQVAYLDAHPTTLLVSGHRWRWYVADKKRIVERYGVRRPDLFRRELCVHNVLGNTSMPLMRRGAFERAGGFNEAIRWAEEWELWQRIAADGDVWVLPEPLIIYRVHPASLSYQVVAERGPHHFRIARNYIRSFRPAWLRPWLLARAWSNTEYYEAFNAVNYGFSRPTQIGHALGALIAYPFEQPRRKLRVVADALLGRRLVTQLYSLVALK